MREALAFVRLNWGNFGRIVHRVVTADCPEDIYEVGGTNPSGTIFYIFGVGKDWKSAIEDAKPRSVSRHTRNID